MAWRSLAISLQVVVATVAAVNAPAASSYFINGGYIETANYSIHETIIPIFKAHLLGQNVTILNAGGKNTLVIPVLSNGTIKRTNSGLIVQEPTSINAEAATKSNVKKIFSELSLLDGNVTIVFGDHGGKEGICLWNNETLTSSELQELHSKLKEQTLVRSIHLHCYSGAAMVPKERKVPLKEEEWKAYLKKYYRPNSCALGMSLHDEVSVYYGWPSGQAWDVLLKENRPQNLVDLKKLFINDDKFTSTPVLTSDYLISDIKEFICNVEKSNNYSFSKKDTHTDNQKNTRPIVTENPCVSSTLGNKIRELEEKYKNTADKLHDIQRLIRRIAKVILEHYGGLSPKIQIETREKIERIKAEFVLSLRGRMPTTQEEKELEEKLNALRTKELVEYENALESVVWGFYLRDEMENYFKLPVFTNWFDGKGKEEFPVAYKLLKDSYYKNLSIFYIESLLSKERTKIQKERKDLIIKQQEIDKKFVLSFIDKYPQIKETYDSIKNCEYSSF